MHLLNEILFQEKIQKNESQESSDHNDSANLVALKPVFILHFLILLCAIESLVIERSVLLFKKLFNRNSYQT